MIFFVMRASLAGSHVAAFGAEEAMLEVQRRDAQLFGREGLEAAPALRMCRNNRLRRHGRDRR